MTGDGVSESATEGGEAVLEGVEEGTLGEFGGGEVEGNFAAGAGQGLEVGGKLDADPDGCRYVFGR